MKKTLKLIAMIFIILILYGGLIYVAMLIDRKYYTIIQNILISIILVLILIWIIIHICENVKNKKKKK